MRSYVSNSSAQDQKIVQAIAAGDSAAAESAVIADLTYLRKHIEAAGNRQNGERAPTGE
jgi:DNA-binding GntR family transcriptional regulator